MCSFFLCWVFFVPRFPSITVTIPPPIPPPPSPVVPSIRPCLEPPTSPTTRSSLSAPWARLRFHSRTLSGLSVNTGERNHWWQLALHLAKGQERTQSIVSHQGHDLLRLILQNTSPHNNRTWDQSVPTGGVITINTKSYTPPLVVVMYFPHMHIIVKWDYCHFLTNAIIWLFLTCALGPLMTSFDGRQYDDLFHMEYLHMYIHKVSRFFSDNGAAFFPLSHCRMQHSPFWNNRTFRRWRMKMVFG